MTFELKVPFISDSDIEHATQELLRKYSKARGTVARPPIPVEDIIEGYFKLELAFTDLRDMLGMPDVLGATFLKEQRIFIEESLELGGQEGRLMFTMAHEVGHWYLHRPLIEMEQVTAPLFAMKDVPQQPAIVCRSRQGGSAEIQADRFAARLLMPTADVRASVRALYGDKLPTWEHVEELRRKREFDEKLHALAVEIIAQGGFTNVSNEAMRNRLCDLKLVVDASAPQLRLL